MHGCNCIRHWPATQPTIALSSGEADLSGMCKGASQLIGMHSISTDLGFTFELQMATDATEAMGITGRLGIGRVRHLDTRRCWVQTQFRNGGMDLEKPGQNEFIRHAHNASVWPRDPRAHEEAGSCLRGMACCVGSTTCAGCMTIARPCAQEVSIHKHTLSFCPRRRDEAIKSVASLLGLAARRCECMSSLSVAAPLALLLFTARLMPSDCMPTQMLVGRPAKQASNDDIRSRRCN